EHIIPACQTTIVHCNLRRIEWRRGWTRKPSGVLIKLQHQGAEGAGPITWFVSRKDEPQVTGVNCFDAWDLITMRPRNSRHTWHFARFCSFAQRRICEVVNIARVVIGIAAFSDTSPEKANCASGP